MTAISLREAAKQRLADLFERHKGRCSCDVCEKFRADMEAIRESEREAWRSARDIIID